MMDYCLLCLNFQIIFSFFLFMRAFVNVNFFHFVIVVASVVAVVAFFFFHMSCVQFVFIALINYQIISLKNCFRFNYSFVYPLSLQLVFFPDSLSLISLLKIRFFVIHSYGIFHSSPTHINFYFSL